MVLIDPILLLDLHVLVDVFNQFDEIVAVLRVLSRLDESQALLQFLLEALVDVVAALAVLDEG
jgi:hypothetical protein